MHGRARLGAVWVRLIPKFASIIERCNPEPENKLLRSFRLSAAAFGADELAAYSGPRFAGFGSPGSITSGSVIGGSGTSPGFSIGGGAGSGFGISAGGSGGMLPGGTPGPGPGGLGTCCISPRSSMVKLLSVRQYGGPELPKRIVAQRVPKKRPSALEPGKPRPR